jgi:opacity protein-like surface antigen
MMKKLLLTLGLSLAALPVHADEMAPTKGTDLPPARATAPAQPAAPAEAAPVAAPEPAAMPAEAAPAAPAAMPVAAAASKWYGNVNIGVSRAELDSGGYNTAGGFRNTGDDHDDGFGFVGLSVGRLLGNNLRAEAEFTGRKCNDFTTNSIAPPTFYDSCAQTYSGMLNLFYDYAINSKWSAFVGAGLGAAFVDLETSDGVVKGSGTEANFAWQAMLGAAYAFDKANSVNFGYRYFDAGNTDISLRDPGGAPAGNFEADMTYQDIFVGLKHMF